MKTQKEIKAIEEEQRKLAEHFRSVDAKEREKQAYGLLCWLQGHEAGYQAGKSAREEIENG